MAASNSQTIEIRQNPAAAWILIITSVAFFLLGLFAMSPLAARQNVWIGLGLVLISVAGFFGGKYMLKRLPVMMRLKHDGLEVPQKKTTYAWSEIQSVHLKSVRLTTQVNYLCIQLTPEAKRKYNVRPDKALMQAFKAIGGDFDLMFSDQNFNMTAEAIKAEIENRVRRSRRSRR